MADGQPTEASPPDRQPRLARARRASRRAWAGAIARSRRLRARLVAASRRLRARLIKASRRLGGWSVARARRHWPWLVAASRKSWRWLLTVARKVDAAAKEGPPPPPPDEPVERRELAGPFTVYARGYVFTFTIRAAFTWRALGLRPDQLAWYAQFFMPPAVQRLTGIAAGLARNVPPHRAGDLEEELQRVLGRQEPWRFERGGQTVTCRPEAWVRLDERVRQTLQPYWERMIELDCRHEEFLRRARYAEQLNEHWSTILADQPDADVPESQREELARLREQMVAEQRAAARWTRELLRQRRHRPDLFGPFTDLDTMPKPRTPSSGPAERPHQTEPAETPPAGTTSAARRPTEAQPTETHSRRPTGSAPTGQVPEPDVG